VILFTAWAPADRTLTSPTPSSTKTRHAHPERGSPFFGNFKRKELCHQAGNIMPRATGTLEIVDNKPLNMASF